MTNGKKTGGKTDILLVSDNAAENSQLLNVLRKAKIVNRLHVLAEGREVLEFLFRKGKFEKDPPLPAEMLILLSLNLKNGASLEVLRQIKSDERSRNYPIIVLTGSQSDRGVMEAYKAGANAAIVQPIDTTKFIEAVAELRLGWLLISPDEH